MKRAAPKRAARRGREAAAVSAVLVDDPTNDQVAAVVPSAAPPRTQGLALQADCTARTAVELKAGLLAVLEAPEAVGIDASAVERVDTVSLQLLVAFAQDRRLAGRAVTWQGASEPFRQAALLLGLAPALDISSRD